MPRLALWLILVTLVGVLMSACNGPPTGPPASPTPPTQSVITLNPPGTSPTATDLPLTPTRTPPPIRRTPTPQVVASAQVEAILAGMSLEERVGQLFMLGYYDASPTLDIVDLVEQGRIGGIVLFAHNIGNPAETAAVVNRLQAAAVQTVGIPLLIATDQEGGVVARLREDFAAWPNAMTIAATGDLELAESIGAGIAEELRAVGINMNLAPVADVLTNPDNTVIGVRSFGGEPEVVAAFAGATLRGFHAMGLIATAKHFPGHGATNLDSHDQLPVDARRRATVEADMLPFRALIAAGVDAIMTAHVVYPFLSDDGLPATFSRSIVTDLLRGELGFNGLILSDALSMGAVLEQYSVEEAVERAILAGVDMVTFGRGVSPEVQLAAIQHLLTLVEAGEISEARINASVRRILILKERYGLLDWAPINETAVTFDLSAHQELSYTAAAYAVTLLRDRAGLLPLDADGRVTVVYPVDFWGTRNAFRTYDPDVEAIGISYNVSAADQEAVLSAAAGGGTVVVLTVNVNEYPSQADLVSALPASRTVVVAIRSPFDLLAFPDVNTYLLTYSGNDHALFSLARMLYGYVGAPGRLPVDLPGQAINGFGDWEGE